MTFLEAATRLEQLAAQYKILQEQQQATVDEFYAELALFVVRARAEFRLDLK